MTKDIVSITDAAKEYINERCDGGCYLVSVKINNKGCSGHSYEYGLIDRSAIGPMDETIVWTGGGISISALSVMYMMGSVLDVKTSIMESYLVWDNPKSTDHCGCGTSFAING